VSPSGFYAWQSRPESDRKAEDRRLGVLVREAHERGRRTYGCPRVHAVLKAGGEHVSRKRVGRLMREQGLCGVSRRRRTRTTDSRHDLPVAANLLDRAFTAEAPNERWVGDVTYLSIPQGWLYLAVILDLYSRMVVGWALGMVNDRWLALRALDQAVRRRRPGHGLLHHSDRGSPYASEDYQKKLASWGIVCSMSRSGDCYDNAAMESWFATFKTELGESFAGEADAEAKVFDYVEVFYNHQRLHSTLGYRSPYAFERAASISAA
jgi:putative transposase